jgi:hypothetical protein
MEAAGACLRKHDCVPADTLIVCDRKEIVLEFGLREAGDPGGARGEPQ